MRVLYLCLQLFEIMLGERSENLWRLNGKVTEQMYSKHLSV